MTISDIAVSLTGERMMTKDTSGHERPSRDEIARLAYHFYETRGRRDGQDIDDWLSAERELTQEIAKVATQRNRARALLARWRRSGARGSMDL